MAAEYLLLLETLLIFFLSGHFKCGFTHFAQFFLAPDKQPTSTLKILGIKSRTCALMLIDTNALLDTQPLLLQTQNEHYNNCTLY